MKPVYDTIEGIESFLLDLDGFNKLKDFRREAYYTREERLTEYIVFGRFYLDTCGNFSIIIKERGYSRSIIPIEFNSELPSVMYYADVKTELPINSSICSTGYHLPPSYVTCSICEEHFNIKNCHNVVDKYHSENYDMTQFAGLKLKDIKEIPKYVHKIKHYVSNDIIGSDNYINTDGGNIKGWKNINKDYVIKPGDKASISIFSFSHKECDNLHRIESSLKIWENLLIDAGITEDRLNRSVQLNGIANRYCPCDSCPPWYILKITGLAPIILGWRKSVINIDWSRSGVDLSDLFSNQDVTKDEHMIHAWGYEKASDYLSRIVYSLHEAQIGQLTNNNQ